MCLEPIKADDKNATTDVVVIRRFACVHNNRVARELFRVCAMRAPLSRGDICI